MKEVMKEIKVMKEERVVRWKE